MCCITVKQHGYELVPSCDSLSLNGQTHKATIKQEDECSAPSAKPAAAAEKCKMV